MVFFCVYLVVFIDYYVVGDVWEGIYVKKNYFGGVVVEVGDWYKSVIVIMVVFLRYIFIEIYVDVVKFCFLVFEVVKIIVIVFV